MYLIKDILKSEKTSLSFEFFPPKSRKGADELFNTIEKLEQLSPSFVSITYGAAGSSRNLTGELVIKLHKKGTIPVVAHLSCRGNSADELLRILRDYHINGIRNIMALRGDPPEGADKFVPAEGGFKYAYEFVKFIKKHFPDMGIGVAGYPEGHPETPNRMKEMDYLKQKIDAGADYICTQLFFDNRDFYDFRERCELAGIKVPVLAGIMPITSRKMLAKIPALALGTRIPAKLLRSLMRADNDETFSNIGIHWATEQVNDLLNNHTAGIHFYTLNKSVATRKIYASLGI